MDQFEAQGQPQEALAQSKAQDQSQEASGLGKPWEALGLRSSGDLGRPWEASGGLGPLEASGGLGRPQEASSLGRPWASGGLGPWEASGGLMLFRGLRQALGVREQGLAPKKKQATW